MSRRNWTRDELMIAFNLYCQLPFSVTNANRKEVKELAGLLDRTPSAVCWKLVNFASLDPSLQAKGIKGASNTSKADRAIFDEFYQNWDQMIYESEMLLSKLKKEKSIENHTIEIEKTDDTNDIDKLIYSEKEGLTTERLVKVRVNQNFFRKMVLSSYENKCCLTGISIPSLLVASHIVPWAKDEKNRLNPENGLCLNNLHDKAFDKGLITLNMDYEIIVSKALKNLEKNQSIQDFFLAFENKSIQLPSRFLPNREFIEYHNQNIFIG